MGHLYNLEGITAFAPGLFTNVQATTGGDFVYWSGDTGSDSTNRWSFSFVTGVQATSQADDDGLFAWAVRTGDVGVIPIPAGIWLFGSGLLGIIGIAGSKKAA